MNIPADIYGMTVLALSLISACFTYAFASQDNKYKATAFSFFIGILFLPASWLYSAYLYKK